MIAVANQNGELLRLLPEATGEFGLHHVFGFIFKDAVSDRVRRRKAHGIKTQDAWVCELKFTEVKNKLVLEPIAGCEIESAGENTWNVKTSSGVFRLMPAASAKAPVMAVAAEEKTQFNKAVLITLAILLMIPVLFGRGTKTEDLVMPVLEPITVKIEPQVQKAVVVPSAMPVETNAEIKKITHDDQKVKRAIQQNLGFLGLLGNKNLTKAIGGATTVKDASAGAGAGGNAGSGGEYLQGLGAGVKHATVGNTGVAGLGGIGTKGAGGGAGGYGNSMVGSGEGRSLSKVAMSQDMVLEGGLDKAVIQATIAKYLSQVRACYEGGLQSNPGLAGQVNMNFVIAGNGSVTTAKTGKSSLGNPQVESCIESKMLNWQFPKPVGGVNVKVNYPFVLRPVGA